MQARRRAAAILVSSSVASMSAPAQVAAPLQSANPFLLRRQRRRQQAKCFSFARIFPTARIPT